MDDTTMMIEQYNMHELESMSYHGVGEDGLELCFGVSSPLTRELFDEEELYGVRPAAVGLGIAAGASLVNATARARRIAMLRARYNRRRGFR